MNLTNFYRSHFSERRESQAAIHGKFLLDNSDSKNIELQC